MIGRNDPCWCDSGKKWKKCHHPEIPPLKVTDELRHEYKEKFDILIKTPEQIEGIRLACQLTARILQDTAVLAKAGVPTIELDAFAEEEIQKAGAVSAALHYGSPPFPRHICISPNDVICHGIADQTPLKNGDIINIDVACVYNGYYGDCSRMVCIGEVGEEKERVVNTSYECLMESIAILKPNVPVSAIGDTITRHATASNCSVVHQFVAHGVGVHFHEGPQIPHCRNHVNIPLLPGMTFTIEPMINAGSPNAVIDPYDKWTARTPDRKPSAQWEHTVLITENGHEILTNWER